MFGQLLRKTNLMSLVAISTQLTSLAQQEYLEPATVSQVCYFASRMPYKLAQLHQVKQVPYVRGAFLKVKELTQL